MKNLLPERLYSPIVPRPDAPDGEPVRAICFNTSEDEAGYIASYIDRHAQGEFDRFAVCYRMRAVGSWVERALMFSGIPFINLNGTSFWKIKHVQIAWQYLALVYGNKKQQKNGYQYTFRIASDQMRQPSDMRSKETGTILKERGQRINHRWIGKAFLRDYPTYGDAIRANVSGWKLDGVEDMIYTYDSIKQQPNWIMALDWIISHVVVPWYVTEYGLVSDNDGSFSEDMGVLREIAGGYNTARDFLEFIDSINKMAEQDDKNAVILGTIHKVKGGEWDTVFVAGMAETICPTPYALGLVPPPDRGYLPPPPSNSGVIDERFCYYVGLTRAKNVAFITCPLVWRDKSVEPSRFISESGLHLEYDSPDSEHWDKQEPPSAIVG